MCESDSSAGRREASCDGARTPRSQELRAAQARIDHQAGWVDVQIRQAVARGDFEQLPGLGKPLPDLSGEHDPDWWVKKLIEREQITGVLPPALQIRKADAALDGELDRLTTEAQVGRAVQEFNAAVHRARFQPQGGPPMITMPREVEAEIEQWRSRRLAHRARYSDGQPVQATPGRRVRGAARRRRWPRWPGRSSQ